MRATVAVASAFRASALSALHAIAGTKKSFLLSGHCSDGKPDLEHRHAYYLPQVDETGGLAGLLVVTPSDRFERDEIEALRIMKGLQWNGPSTRLRLELIDDDDRSSVQLAARWVSATPYVPTRRFWGTHGKHHLTPEKQLAAELHKVGAKPTDVMLQSWLDVSVRAAPKKNKTPKMRRVSFRAEFRLEAPVCAPMALGHSCHFGLGQFVPML